MSSENSFIKEIKTYADSMKLSVIKGDIDVAIEEANANNLVMSSSYVDSFKKNVI